MLHIAVLLLLGSEGSMSQETLENICSSDTDDHDCRLQNVQNMQQNLAAYVRTLEDQIERQSFKDCSDLLHKGYTSSGIYEIYTGYYSEPRSVYCDMDNDGGGWTVFQRREDGSVNFERTWDEYKHGFGNLTGEHWLGNKYIQEITHDGRAYDLKILLTDWDDIQKYAKYSFFTVDYERNKFGLDYAQYLQDESTVGDSLAIHKGQSFTTLDQDNDRRSDGNCASIFGGFWHKDCHTVGLNNHWSPSRDGYGDDPWDRVRWDSWHGYQYSLKATAMMIRPID